MIWYGSNCKCGGTFDRLKRISVGNASQDVAWCSKRRATATREGVFAPSIRPIAEALMEKP